METLLSRDFVCAPRPTNRLRRRVLHHLPVPLTFSRSAVPVPSAGLPRPHYGEPVTSNTSPTSHTDMYCVLGGNLASRCYSPTIGRRCRTRVKALRMNNAYAIRRHGRRAVQRLTTAVDHHRIVSYRIETKRELHLKTRDTIVVILHPPQRAAAPET